ncbi:hypothetical protein SeseC_02049 [Streptococcus equi subsp. zooepidemicus ATCC 35246]|nr:hypothetical protein SeseC_02049 [Streptococcus equi subsp. zooepidemicus ATCC 35246]
MILTLFLINRGITIQDASMTFQDLNTESSYLSAILGLLLATGKK